MAATARQKSDLIDVVEAVYDLDPSGGDSRWLTGVLEHFCPILDQGKGVCVFLSTRDEPFRAVAGRGTPDGWDSAMGQLMVSSAQPQLLPPPRPALTGSDAVGRQAFFDNPAMRDHFHRVGIFDGVGVTANDGGETLVTFVGFLPAIGTIHRSVATRLERVSAHVAAGWRLRRALHRPAAVLAPSGKVVHAEGRARESNARERLRDAARAIDRARSRLRRADNDAALELWRVLVDGEWSLVDRFDSDGRRYLIAQENPPPVRDPRGIGRRELQVLSLTALGHPSKMIGYELGISAAAVSSARARGMRKLGLKTLAEVAQLLHR